MNHIDSTILAIVDELQKRYQEKVVIVPVRQADNDSELKKNNLGLGESLPPSAVVQKIKDSQLAHIVQTSNPQAPDELAASAEIMAEIEAFFRCPIQGILRPKNEVADSFKHFQKVFDNSSQKIRMLEDLKQYLSSFVKRQSAMNEILLIADEMFSNAIYNAPFINSHGDKGASRENPDVQSDKESVFLAGANEDQLAMACIDQYGTLNLESLLSRIQNCYEKGADEMMDKTGEGGAGLGVFMVFNGSASLYSLVKPGKFTCMAVTIPLGLSRRKSQSIEKSLHCSVIEDDFEIDHLFRAG